MSPDSQDIDTSSTQATPASASTPGAPSTQTANALGTALDPITNALSPFLTTMGLTAHPMGTINTGVQLPPGSPASNADGSTAAGLSQLASSIGLNGLMQGGNLDSLASSSVINQFASTFGLNNGNASQGDMMAGVARLTESLGINHLSQTGAAGQVAQTAESATALSAIASAFGLNTAGASSTPGSSPPPKAAGVTGANGTASQTANADTPQPSQVNSAKAQANGQVNGAPVNPQTGSNYDTGALREDQRYIGTGSPAAASPYANNSSSAIAPATAKTSSGTGSSPASAAAVSPNNGKPAPSAPKTAITAAASDSEGVPTGKSPFAAAIDMGGVRSDNLERRNNFYLLANSDGNVAKSAPNTFPKWGQSLDQFMTAQTAMFRPASSTSAAVTFEPQGQHAMMNSVAKGAGGWDKVVANMQAQQAANEKALHQAEQQRHQAIKGAYARGELGHLHDGGSGLNSKANKALGYSDGHKSTH